jgi:predicted alpha/beta superfamily hydrolase/ketosteroid isomerase-like protein
VTTRDSALLEPVTRFLERWAGGDLDGATELLQDDAEVEEIPALDWAYHESGTLGVFPRDRKTKGRAAWRDGAQPLALSAPDATVRTTLLATNAPVIVLVAVVRGTHSAEGVRAPATGRRFGLRGLLHARVVDGRIGQLAAHWDVAAVLADLGYATPRRQQGSWSPDFVGGVTGDVRRHARRRSRGLRLRDVSVWLPPGYDEDEARRYPVLYMHDGQNVFDPATAFAGIDWQVDETATRLIAEGRLDPLVVVAVNNTQDRMVEYLDNERGYRYVDFLADELKPFIDATYRTRPERESTGVMGSSAGGLASLLAAWRRPEVFGLAGLLSPYIPLDTHEVLARDGWRERPVRLYVDNGSDELDSRLQPMIDQLLRTLRRQGFRRGRDLTWYLDAGAPHNESAWAARAWRPLTFLFPSVAPSPPDRA